MWYTNAGKYDNVFRGDITLAVVIRFITEYFVIPYVGDMNMSTIIVTCFLIYFVLVAFIIFKCGLYMGLKYREKYYLGLVGVVK